MIKNCTNCEHAIITLIAECSKNTDDGKWLFSDGLCPEEMICPFWEKACEITQSINDIDWGSAAIIEVE